MRASVYVACAIVALVVLVTTGVSDAQTADGSIVMIRKNFSDSWSRRRIANALAEAA